MCPGRTPATDANWMHVHYSENSTVLRHAAAISSFNFNRKVEKEALEESPLKGEREEETKWVYFFQKSLFYIEDERNLTYTDLSPKFCMGFFFFFFTGNNVLNQQNTKSV